MLATAILEGLRENIRGTFFASGVSNSECVDPIKFARERELLLSSLRDASPESFFVYFGTCSIYDPEMQESPYVIHKKSMENLVLRNQLGVVIRLPQLVGRLAPSNTLIRFLVERIQSGERVCIWNKAQRSIIDVEDVVKIMESWLLRFNSQIHERVVNIANPNNIYVLDLIKSIENTLALKADVTLLEKGSSYRIDVMETLTHAHKLGINFEDSYIPKLLEKYYKTPRSC